jgi:site-specific DNA recombinase
VSAFDGRRRPGYAELCELIAAGTVDVVVAWSVDRLYRRPVELEGLVDLVERTGTTVATVTSGRFDLATPEGRAMARVGAAIAASESERKSLRNRIMPV